MLQCFTAKNDQHFDSELNMTELLQTNINQNSINLAKKVHSFFYLSFDVNLSEHSHESVQTF